MSGEDVEKGEDEKVLMKSSVIHSIQPNFLMICTFWELLCAPEGSEALQGGKSLLTNWRGVVLKEYGWQKTRFVKQHVEQLMHPFLFL